MAAMPRSANPNLGFRGNPDSLASGSLIDYGVYAGPLHRALLRYGYRSQVMTYVADQSIKRYIQRGWPVVVWVTYQLLPSTPVLALHNGVQFFLVRHEHALLVVGYDQGTIWANDPWNAQLVRYRWRDFNRSWGYFGDMALAIEPCPLAQPVTAITLASVSTASISWSWTKAANAARYQVTIVHGAQNTPVFQGTQAGTRISIPNPIPGEQYEISVSSVSACGDVTTAAHLVTLLPKHLPPAVTPTPTPAPEKTVVVTPTVTPSVVPSGTPTLTPSPAPSSTVHG